MSKTPETHEAVERWQQGKINIFDEMARLERERNEMSESNEVLLADLHYTRQDLKDARKALEEIASLDTSQDASPQQCAAVLLAMNALGK